MNLDDLTIGQAKQLATQFAAVATHGNDHTLTDAFVGQYVIVRSSNEGINAGFVERADETGIVLRDARRIWYHRPADKSVCWYEGVAETGVSDDSKLSCAVSYKAIVEDYSITICSTKAAESIRSAKSHEQD